MCIIIDTNTLANVFNKRSTNHSEFKPVLDWIMDGNGIIVYGGTKYLREIRSYLDFFLELGNRRKAINIDKQKVDTKERWAATKIKHRDFDDQHLIGLLLVSGCKLICTQDRSAFQFLTHNLFFPLATKRPKIYSKRRNSDLLTNANMADICKPGIKLSAMQKQELSSYLKNN